MKEKYKLFIGIDPGTNTGIAWYNPDTKRLIDVRSLMIHEAIDQIKYTFIRYGSGLKVYFEDARKRKWFGNSGREKLQGAGSIKRDCKIWEDFLKANKIEFGMIAPNQNKTKLTKEQFIKITGYKESTNEHGRDAAMLVFNR